MNRGVTVVIPYPDQMRSLYAHSPRNCENDLSMRSRLPVRVPMVGLVGHILRGCKR